MSTRSRRIRTSLNDISPPRTRKGVSPTRSPARTRKSSPPKRTTSPARKSPSRKSPSRKPASQYPARKSPSRATAKETIEVTQKSPAKRPAIKTSARELSVQLDNLSSKLEIFRSTRSKRLEYTIKDVTSSITPSEFSLENVNGLETFNDSYSLRIRKPLEKDNIEELVPRRSSRLRDYTENVPDTRRSLSKSVSKSISKSIDTFSDGENSDDELVREKSKSQSVTRKLATPLRSSIDNFVQVTDRWEFGGRIGSALLIFVIPLTVFTLLISCMKSCSHKAVLNLSTYKSLSQWFSPQAFLFVIVQLITQAVFAVLPILGTKADRMDESGTKYCFNAFFSSIFTIHLLFILDFWQVIDKDALINDYLKLAVVSYIFAVILSIVAYVKSCKIDVYELNPYGNTGYVLYDFFMGREIHPHVMGLDIKVWISRISNINALILSALIFQRGLDLPLNDNDIISFGNYKELLNKVQLQPTILIFSMMQLIYILNFIMREYRITTTFFWHSEGVGYLQIVASALYPFYFTTISKYVVDTELSLSTNTLISASVLYVLGISLMLISNNIKYEFRKNPLHPSLQNLDSMPTFHGKKLLISNIWGVLRHPNYTGDIMIHAALALPGILTHQIMGAAPALLTIVVLIHRSWRDHARCKRRYGAAWQRYCKRVPSIIIPKLILSALIFQRGLDLPLNDNDIISFGNYKELLNKVQLQPTILIFSMMQLIYILNFIMREYRITTTFFWHSEGVGYLQIVASALYPFYFTTISKNVVDTELSLSTNTLISASVLYVLGISLMLISNNIKYEFRKNPLHPSLQNLDSMPTFHGKKLLISNIWGVLRHPNYTGDIMIHAALALPGVLTHQIMGAAPALLTIVVLIHRSWRDHARCKRRYGAAWQRYCKRVPSIIIPKVL